MTENERFTVSGSQVLEKVKQLIREGNIRKVRLLHDGKTILEIPLTIGAPVAVVGILAAGNTPGQRLGKMEVICSGF